jgi:hypothetical protein
MKKIVKARRRPAELLVAAFGGGGELGLPAVVISGFSGVVMGGFL